MQHIETIAIDRPMAVVWELVGNPSNWARWMAGMTDIRLDGAMVPGTTLTYKWRGKDRNTTVTRFIDHQEIAIRGDEPNYTYTETILVRAMGSMTNVSVSMAFSSKVWWATALTPLLFAIRKVGMGRPIRKSLNALRAEAEKARTPAAA